MSIDDLVKNWAMPSTDDLPKQQVSYRISAELKAKLDALATIYKKKQSEIGIDLLTHAVQDVSDSLEREKVIKAKLRDLEDPNMPDWAFDEAYPGGEDKVFHFGKGYRFDSVWRENLSQIAKEAGQESAEQESKEKEGKDK